MEEQIKLLHNQGLTIQQIHKRLGCARATIAYHIDPVAKEKTLLRIKRQRTAKKASRALKLPKIKLKKVKPIKVKTEKVNPVKKSKKDFKPETKQTRNFKTKDQKLSEKVLVRLDHKTQVYTRYPDDIERLRTKYLK